jgi:hypothetical protein
LCGTVKTAGWRVSLPKIGFARRFELSENRGREKDGSTPAENLANIGARKTISNQIVLPGSGEAGVNGPSEERVHLRVYVGLQVNLPGAYGSGTSPGRNRW